MSDITKKNGRKHRSIRGRILQLVWLTVLPMTVTAVIALASMNSFYRSYDQSVANITQINNFNVSFEEQINRSMYYIIVESYDWEELKNTDQPENPYVRISAFEDTLDEIGKTPANSAIAGDIDAIGKMLTLLRRRIDDIIVNVEEGGHYDENMEMLEANINVLTSLIQDDIQEYISKEVENMEQVHRVLSARVQWYVTALAVLVLILLVMALILSSRISHKITEPIRTMCRMTEDFAGGDFTVRADVTSGDEMDTLAESFNSMVSEISKLVDDIKLEQKNAQDIELRLLQAQINPHFLYNTLDAIMWLVESGQNDQAVSMVSSLSAFFRTTLSKGQDWITVAEEESHIRSYLEIQHFRYTDIMEYDINIAPSVREYYVMKLMLQPIVENALYHGIKNKRGKGLIKVTGVEEGSALVFRVEDNGIGMTNEELERMRKLISGEISDASQNGFGIANVQQRIVLRYGSSYGIHAESTYGQGTVVTVSIPKVLDPAKSVNTFSV